MVDKLAASSAVVDRLFGGSSAASSAALDRTDSSPINGEHKNSSAFLESVEDSLDADFGPGDDKQQVSALQGQLQSSHQQGASVTSVEFVEAAEIAEENRKLRHIGAQLFGPAKKVAEYLAAQALYDNLLSGEGATPAEDAQESSAVVEQQGGRNGTTAEDSGRTTTNIRGPARPPKPVLGALRDMMVGGGEQPRTGEEDKNSEEGEEQRAASQESMARSEQSSSLEATGKLPENRPFSAEELSDLFGTSGWRDHATSGWRDHASGSSQEEEEEDMVRSSEASSLEESTQTRHALEETTSGLGGRLESHRRRSSFIPDPVPGNISFSPGALVSSQGGAPGENEIFPGTGSLRSPQSPGGLPRRGEEGMSGAKDLVGVGESSASTVVEGGGRPHELSETLKTFSAKELGEVFGTSGWSSSDEEDMDNFDAEQVDDESAGAPAKWDSANAEWDSTNADSLASVLLQGESGDLICMTGQKATQSSKLKDHYSFGGGLPINPIKPGDPNPDMTADHCSHTSGFETPWWQTTLPAGAKVHKIKLFNRNAAKDRIHNLRVKIDGQLCGTTPALGKPMQVEVVCNPPKSGSVLRVDKSAANSGKCTGEKTACVLTLCGVHVFGTVNGKTPPTCGPRGAAPPRRAAAARRRRAAAARRVNSGTIQR